MPETIEELKLKKEILELQIKLKEMEREEKRSIQTEDITSEEQAKVYKKVYSYKDYSDTCGKWIPKPYTPPEPKPCETFYIEPIWIYPYFDQSSHPYPYQHTRIWI